MTRVELYKEIKNNLEKYAEFRNIQIDKYYRPEKVIRYGNLKNHYFYMFCGHLQDRQYMGNIIQFYHRGSDTQSILENVLYNYDVNKIVRNYDESKDISDKIKALYPNKIKNDDKWSSYLEGLFQCANYLEKGIIYQDMISISELIKNPEDIDSMKIKLFYIRILKNNLKGVGTAVCYNWLKECGAEWLAKPDLHVKRVVAELLKKKMSPEDYQEIAEDEKMDLTTKAHKIIQKYLDLNKHLRKFPRERLINSNCKLDVDEYVAVYMYEWAMELFNQDKTTTAYMLDRIIYLYCTNGYFYLDDDFDISEDDILLTIQNKYDE